MTKWKEIRRNTGLHTKKQWKSFDLTKECKVNFYIFLMIPNLEWLKLWATKATICLQRGTLQKCLKNAKKNLPSTLRLTPSMSLHANFETWVRIELKIIPDHKNDLTNLSKIGRVVPEIHHFKSSVVARMIDKILFF